MPPTPTSSKHRYPCSFPDCQLSFSKRNHLERHTRVHTGILEFSCPKCHRQFARRDSRNRHVGKLHPEVERSIDKKRKVQFFERQKSGDEEEIDDNLQGEGKSKGESGDSDDGEGVRKGAIDAHMRAAYVDVDDSSLLQHHPFSTMGAHVYRGLPPSLVTIPPPSSVTSFESARHVDDPASSLSSTLISPPYTDCSPSNISSQDEEHTSLDIKRMMSSLLWSALGASIFEMAGSTYLLPEQHAIEVQVADRKTTSPKARDLISTSESAKRTIENIQGLVGYIEASIEPDNDLASSCFWLCRRHFLPTSALVVSYSNVGKSAPDDHALVMYLIAIGSLWHHQEVGRNWGKYVWQFITRVIWRREMLDIDDGDTLSNMMSILLSGHSYVLMSSDPAVHKLGRRAWLHCHILLDQQYSERRLLDDSRDESTNVADGEGVEVDELLSSSTNRAFLRRKPQELEEAWQRWCKKEERIRISAGILIYDGHYATWLDMPPSVPDEVRQQQIEPAWEELIEAKTAASWLDLYEMNPPERRYLDSFLPILFRPFPNYSNLITWTPSQLAAHHILESIYTAYLSQRRAISKASEYWNSNRDSTSHHHLGLIHSLQALANWRLYWSSDSRHRKQKDRYCLLLRWHSIHLTLCTTDFDVVDYLRKQTKHLAVPGEEDSILQSPQKYQSASLLSTEAFFNSAKGSRAIYHAGIICSNLKALPVNAHTPIHVAQAAFEAVLLLVSYALFLKGQSVERQLETPYELLVPAREEEECWKNIGLAGFVNQDTSSDISSAAERDWGKTNSSSARRWIVAGVNWNVTLSGLPICDCKAALIDLSRILEERKLLWCLAKDYHNLINRAISLL